MLFVFVAIATLACGGVLLVTGVVLLGAASAAVGVARASRQWPIVAGRVVRAELRPNRRANLLPGYRVLVRYQYTLDGEEYEGKDIAAGDFPHRSANRAARRAARYPLGATIGGRYFPQRPEIAVLEPGFSIDVLYLSVMASTVLFLGIALLSVGAWSLFQVITR